MQDNVPSHISKTAIAAATKCKFEVLLFPCSQSVAFLDYYLFPNQETNRRGRNLGSNEAVIDAVDEYLKDQQQGFYFEGISKLEQFGESASR